MSQAPTLGYKALAYFCPVEALEVGEKASDSRLRKVEVVTSFQNLYDSKKKTKRKPNRCFKGSLGSTKERARKFGLVLASCRSETLASLSAAFQSGKLGSIRSEQKVRWQHSSQMKGRLFQAPLIFFLANQIANGL